MEETIRLWIKDLGFPIVVALGALYALNKLFWMREGSEDRLKEALRMHGEMIADLSKHSNTALGLNTQATQAQTETIKKLLNADGTAKLCQVDAFQCKAPEKFSELIGVLKEVRDQGIDAAKALLEEKLEKVMKRADAGNDASPKD